MRARASTFSRGPVVPFSNDHRLTEKLAHPDPAARFLARAPANVRAIVERHAGAELSSAPLYSARPAPGVPPAHELDGRAGRRARRAAERAERKQSRRAGAPEAPVVSREVRHPGELDVRAARRAAERVRRKQRRRDRASYMGGLERHRKRVDSMLASHRERMRARRGPEPECPPSFRLQDWRRADACWHDNTGKFARAWLALLPPVWAGIIRCAALGEVDGGVTRLWDSERARAIVILGCVIVGNAHASRRKGKHRYLVRGFTRGAFAAICRGGRGRALHLNTISGQHRMGAPDHSGELGYLDALKRAGLFYSQQLPAEQVTPWERWKVTRGKRGGDGTEDLSVTTNRYWLINPNPYDGHLVAEVRVMLLAFAESALSSAALRLRERARPASSDAPAPAKAPPAPD